MKDRNVKGNARQNRGRILTKFPRSQFRTGHMCLVGANTTEQEVPTGSPNLSLAGNEGRRRGSIQGPILSDNALMVVALQHLLHTRS